MQKSPSDPSTTFERVQEQEMIFSAGMTIRGTTGMMFTDDHVPARGTGNVFRHG